MIHTIKYITRPYDLLAQYVDLHTETQIMFFLIILGGVMMLTLTSMALFDSTSLIMAK